MYNYSLTIRTPVLELNKPIANSWNGGSAFRSHLYNGFSVLFPIGEGEFVNVAREAAEHLVDNPEAWTEAIRGFVAQESVHRKVHGDFNNWIARQGYPVARLEQRLRTRIDKQKNMKIPLFATAVVTCFEHWTAILGHGQLQSMTRTERNWLQGADPEIAVMWGWHAVEEIEHKSVVFDLYQQAGGGYFQRCIAMLYVTVLLWSDALYNASTMLNQDGLMGKWATWKDSFNFFFFKEKVLLHLFLPWLQFFKPGFHPSQTQDKADSDRWLASYAEQLRTIREF